MQCSDTASCTRVWGSAKGTGCIGTMDSSRGVSGNPLSAGALTVGARVSQILLLAVVSWLRAVSLGAGSKLEAWQLCQSGCDLGLDMGSSMQLPRE